MRGYMDYHSDRFRDNSLIIIDVEGRWQTILPATLTPDGILASHAGLTYGGFVMSRTTRAHEPMEWFSLLADYARAEGIRELVYNPVPYIYHVMPADEDLYALFRHNANLRSMKLASVVQLPDGISSRLGKRAVKRANRYGYEVRETENINDFWDLIVDDRKRRHNTTPVHTAAEMQLLRDRFPANIRFFVATAEGKPVAGAVVYVMEGSKCLHLQYAAASIDFAEKYAVDAIYHHLVFEVFPQYKYFDFGTSNEQDGRYLNKGMTAHKEEFGARSVVYQSFSLHF